MADWRIRPIPAEMLKYAREDTHHLLFIYDKMRQELLQKGITSNQYDPRALLRAAMRKSGSLCLKVYEKPVLKDNNYYMVIKKNSKLMSATQKRVIKLLLKLRDYVARLDDESPHYMLSKKSLI